VTPLTPKTTGACTSAGTNRWGEIFQLVTGSPASPVSMIMLSANNTTTSAQRSAGTVEYRVALMPLIASPGGLQGVSLFNGTEYGNNHSFYPSGCAPDNGCGGSGGGSGLGANGGGGSNSGCTDAATYSSGGSGWAISMNECLTQTTIATLVLVAAGTTAAAAVVGLICGALIVVCPLAGALALVATFVGLGAAWMSWADTLRGSIGDY
jgi:hypothetical protein